MRASELYQLWPSSRRGASGFGVLRKAAREAGARKTELANGRIHGIHRAAASRAQDTDKGLREEPDMRLKDKVAIVTGAASGMGASTAKLFAAEGAKVLCADIEESDGRAVVGIITQAGGTALFQKLDVSNEAQWQAAVDATLAAWGTIDILVNNAGVSGSDPDRLSLAVWEQQMTINARGVFLGMRAVVPVMQKARRGSIVNTSSISGIVGQVFVHPGYNAAKGAVRAMTKAAAVQYARDTIRVNSVHPGLQPAMRSADIAAG